MNISSLHRRQRGLSIIAMILVGLIVVGLMLIGFKLVPAVTEYISIDRGVNRIKNEATTVGEIRAAFDKYATAGYITTISGRDLDITKEGDRIVISYAYSYSINIIDNVRLVIDFSGTTRDRPGRQVP